MTNKTHLPPTDPSDRLAPAAAAELLGLRPQTLACWRVSGRYGLPYSRVGGKVYYSRAACLAWLDRRTGTSVAQIAAAIA